jgi:dihydropteroate synthase
VGIIVWQCGRYKLNIERPLIMGIVNVTPDSFSDGGKYREFDAAVAHAHRLISEGADIIDVGGESTRPGSDEVSINEELERTVMVVEALATAGIVVSIDTRHAQVAQAAVQAGAAIINDVSGFRDPAMVALAAKTQVGLIVMHMLGEPKAMQQDPQYDDVVAEVSAYLLAQAAMLEGAGVASERIAIDPGPGFGKTVAHNLALLRATREMSMLSRRQDARSIGSRKSRSPVCPTKAPLEPLLNGQTPTKDDMNATVGASIARPHEHGAPVRPYPLVAAYSRKTFIGKLVNIDNPSERIAGSVTCAVYAATQGASILRVHDVAPTVQALMVIDAI